VRDCFRRCRPAAIFKLQHHLPGNLAISHGRPQAIIRWRVCEAPTAFCALPAVEFERQSAAPAAWLSKEMQSLPAGQAEKVLIRSDRAASRAAGRERKIKHLSCRGPGGAKRNLHPLLSLSRGDGTSPTPWIKTRLSVARYGA
jgi:hypothetical protein